MAAWDNHYGSAGRQYNQGPFYDGYVGELLVYKTALTAAQQQAVQAYLNYKWLGQVSILPAATPLSLSGSGAGPRRIEPDHRLDQRRRRHFHHAGQRHADHRRDHRWLLRRDYLRHRRQPWSLAAALR